MDAFDVLIRKLRKSLARRLRRLEDGKAMLAERTGVSAPTYRVRPSLAFVMILDYVRPSLWHNYAEVDRPVLLG